MQVLLEEYFLRRKILLNLFALCLGLATTTTVVALGSVPGNFYGNLGFNYTNSWAQQGTQTNAAYTTLSANWRSYLYHPWFATYNLGATASMLQNNSGATTTTTNLLYSYFGLSLLPRSRFPFRFNMTYGNDVNNWGIGTLDWIDVGQKQTLYMNARQSYITRKGDRIDAWVTNRTRHYYDAELKDMTYGAKIKTRGSKQNLYANATYQTRSNSLTNLETTNVIAALTHNYFPSTNFYIKTLASTTHYGNNSAVDPTSVFSNRVTDRNQVSSFMYWRPEYRPYTATAGLRLYRRGASLTDLAQTDQLGVNANAAANYTFNRRLRLTTTANTSLIQTKQNAVTNIDTKNVNISALLYYRSDRILIRDFLYNWFASSGVGNSVNMLYQQSTYAQNLNVAVGHTANRVWVTGNRSTFRLNMTQTAREFVKNKPLNTGLNISHMISTTWNKDMRKGRFYSQLSVLDSHIIDDVNSNSQIVNVQFSRLIPLSRLSQWGANLSVQSSRYHSQNDSNRGFLNEFVTRGAGRINYQQARLFGIYKLKFRAWIEMSAIGDLNGGNRKQADAEARLGYNVGKLSTSLIGRGIINNAGLGMGVVVMQLNRSF